MIHPAHRASYECGRDLLARGCPLDYMDNLPRDPSKFRKALYMRLLGGYAASCVIDQGPGRGTDYLIALRLGTDRSRGVVISEHHFRPPWKEHNISWDYGAVDIVPERDRVCYASVMNNARLLDVLDDRQLLKRGHAVDGLLCGRAPEQIPASVPAGATATAELTVIIDSGQIFTLPIELAVVRVHRKIARGEPREPLFERLHVVGRNS